MAEENDIALIESYLQGELDASEKKEVEERLQADTAFKELFDDTSIMLEGLGKLRHKTLLNRIDQLEIGLGNPLEVKKEAKIVFWTLQRVAAAFIGLAIVATASWYLISDDAPGSGSELYASYFEAYDNVIVPIVRSNEDTTLMVRAFRAYEEGDYTSAVVLFDELLKINDQEFVKFYAAISYTEVGQLEKAITLFKTSTDGKGEFTTQATWYLSLAYIKKEAYNNAKPLLESLQENNTYGKRAQQLLKRMR